MTQKDDNPPKVLSFSRKPSQAGTSETPRHLRKQQVRAEKAAAAAANRAKYGRTKAQKHADRAETKRVVKLVDDARRDTGTRHADEPKT